MYRNDTLMVLQRLAAGGTLIGNTARAEGRPDYIAPPRSIERMKREGLITAAGRLTAAGGLWLSKRRVA